MQSPVLRYAISSTEAVYAATVISGTEIGYAATRREDGRHVPCLLSHWSKPYALCPMPYARCPMPDALYPMP
eukprot:1405006-Rhodomonas_salina.1